MVLIYYFINLVDVVMEVHQCVIYNLNTLLVITIKLGKIGSYHFYMNEDQFEKWKHTDLIIDAVKGIGGMFSLIMDLGKRFLQNLKFAII